MGGPKESIPGAGLGRGGGSPNPGVGPAQDQGGCAMGQDPGSRTHDQRGWGMDGAGPRTQTRGKREGAGDDNQYTHTLALKRGGGFVLYIRSRHFHEKNTFHFQASRYCLERNLCLTSEAGGSSYFMNEALAQGPRALAFSGLGPGGPDHKFF